jgi:hypothetical protein
MNRLEEFLQNLDLKNKIMVYFSVVIIGIIFYYEYNYSVLYSNINNNNENIKKLEKKLHFADKTHNKKLIKLKKEYKKLELIKNEKVQDLRYLKERISLSHLNINDKIFYSILENILYKSEKLNLAPNFHINKKFSKFKQYIVDINGTLNNCQENDLFNLVKFLESNKYLTNINKFNLDLHKKDGDKYIKFFYINYNIWGIK